MILYLNTYKEPRVLIVSANNDRECEDIIHARGLKHLAYFEMSKLISQFKNKNKIKEKN